MPEESPENDVDCDPANSGRVVTIAMTSNWSITRLILMPMDFRISRSPCVAAESAWQRRPGREPLFVIEVFKSTPPGRHCLSQTCNQLSMTRVPFGYIHANVVRAGPRMAGHICSPHKLAAQQHDARRIQVPRTPLHRFAQTAVMARPRVGIVRRKDR